MPWCWLEETHSGAVVMLGDRVYKFKKPVDLAFLDFRDPQARLQACEREVSLNRRLSPDVYLGVGELRDPSGSAEPVVVMRRMPGRLQLSRMVRDHADVTVEVQRVARQIATFHARARSGPEVVAEGTRDALRRRWRANIDETRSYAGDLLDAETVDEVAALATRFLDGREDLFDDRILRGAIVDGHGDLTADDVFCLPNGPRLLDCLDFDDRLRYVDRLDDIAFLAMGLERLGAPEAAATLIETWAEHLDDPAPASLVHHFIAYRAFVRAKVGCLPGAAHGWPAASPRVYADAALAHLRAGAVTLVLVGGPPGSGKTTLAGDVADRLGMVVLSSDRVRKELIGIDPCRAAAAPVGGGIYDAVHTEMTYAALQDRAEVLLRRGESVVLDASWTTATARAAAARLADSVSADLVALRCEVDARTADDRIRRRTDVSDADEIIAAALREAADPWPTSHAIDTGGSRAECLEVACSRIRPHAPPHARPRRLSQMEPD
ncbi:gluconate kinase [Nocardioides sp.]|nr:gluconate kinase [Nocardioides sp.]